MEGSTWAAMADKYGQLAALATQPEGDPRKNALRQVAARWPGALREAELIGPERVDARLDAAGTLVDSGARRRDAGYADLRACAVLLWAELHPLLGDLLRYRATARQRADVAGFVGWLARADTSERWPDAARLPEVVGPKLRVRGAYLWLAARAGLSLPTLNQILFDRRGHWDARDGDPAWAR